MVSLSCFMLLSVLVWTSSHFALASQVLDELTLNERGLAQGFPCPKDLFGRDIISNGCVPSSENSRSGLRSRQRQRMKARNRYRNRNRCQGTTCPPNRSGNRNRSAAPTPDCNTNPTVSPSPGATVSPTTRAPATSSPVASRAAPPTLNPSPRPTTSPSASPTTKPSARPVAKPSPAPVAPVTPYPTRTRTTAPTPGPSAMPSVQSRSGGGRCCEDPVNNQYGRFEGVIVPQTNVYDPFNVIISYAENGITLQDSVGCGNNKPDSNIDVTIEKGMLYWRQVMDYGIDAAGGSDGPCGSNITSSLVHGADFWQYVGLDESRRVLLGQLNFTCSAMC